MSKSTKGSNIRLVKWYVWFGYHDIEYSYFVNACKRDYHALMVRGRNLQPPLEYTLLIGIL